MKHRGGKWVSYSARIFLVLVLFLSFDVSARVAFFRENAYLNLGFGAFQCDQFNKDDVYIKKHLKISPVFTFGVGYKFSNYIRSSINFRYNNVNYKADAEDRNLKQNIKVISSMLNIDYSVYTGVSINPYITLGIGVSRNLPTKLTDMRSSSEVKTKARTNFAWDVGCGVILDNLSSHYSIDIGYRYVDLGKIYTENFDVTAMDVTQRIKGHQGIFSVFFRF